MNKYSWDDVIINPGDGRLEIGKKYYFNDTPGILIEIANHKDRDFLRELKEIDPSLANPFIDSDGCDYVCVIRASESRKSKRPYDFSDPEVRTSLLGRYVVYKMSGGYVQNGIISAFIYDSDGMWRCSIGGVLAQTAEQLMTCWEYIDGSLCGEEVENG